MAHDADFSGRQLRLAAFLRAVETGMPPRPARFQRRHVADKPNISNLSDIVVNRAAKEDLVNVYAAESMTLPVANKPFLKTLPVDQNERNARPIHRNKSKKGLNEFPRICKRRLPVNELALLRTTTSDGVPGPRDASTVFAAAITDCDPIEDSQSLSLATATPSSSRRPYRSIAPQHPKPNLTRISALWMGGIAQVKLERSQISTNPPLLGSLRNDQKPKPRSGFDGASSGFIGSELVVVPRKKLPKRCNTVWTVAKNTTATKSLILASGLLPMPFYELPIDRSQISFKPNSPQTAPESGLPPTLPRKLSNAVRLYKQERSSYNRESTIRDQLSSITAPARHDSESSESNNEAEMEWCTDDDDDDENCDLVDFDYEHPPPRQSGTQTSTYVDDGSYFENAIQYLDVADMNACQGDILYCSLR